MKAKCYSFSAFAEFVCMWTSVCWMPFYDVTLQSKQTITLHLKAHQEFISSASNWHCVDFTCKKRRKYRISGKSAFFSPQSRCYASKQQRATDAYAAFVYFILSFYFQWVLPGECQHLQMRFDTRVRWTELHLNLQSAAPIHLVPFYTKSLDEIAGNGWARPTQPQQKETTVFCQFAHQLR